MPLRLCPIIIFVNIFALAPIIFLMIVLDKVVSVKLRILYDYIRCFNGHFFNFLLTYYKSASLIASKGETNMAWSYSVDLQLASLNL